MNCKPGSILLVPYPFSDLTTQKKRPVLVVRRADRMGDFIAMPITSRSRHEEALPIGNDRMVSGSLPKPSWVRFDRVISLNISLVIKELAEVEKPLVEEAVSRFCNQLG